MPLPSLAVLLLQAAAPPLAALPDTSPDVAAAEAELDAARADLRAARGGWLPQLRVEGQAGALEETFTINAAPGAPDAPSLAGSLTARRDPASAALIVEQPLLTSGRVGGAVGAARAQADAAAAAAEAARQDVLLAGAVAIADVVRDRAALAERRDNEALAGARLEEARARRSAGLATVTDLSQSEARLALAEADRIAAEAALSRAEATYRRLFGAAPPPDLALPTPGAPLPTSAEAAVSEALSAAPDLIATRARARAAQAGVRQARGARLPQVSLAGEALYASDERFGLELGTAEQYGVFVRARWNLWDGGASDARTRAARGRAEAERARLDAARRAAAERASAAFADLESARGGLAARERQAAAAEAARDGVAAELGSGRRTRLDLLDADRELAAAEVGIIAARRDLTVARYSLLRAVGRLSD